ncbi:Uncharacterized protein dnm_066580 [Desulfonema magnum]|uniref:Uncharacterized protein n=1 Tax=Desulfonema magnum TaxID=45655 RepID=A0A975GR68_9BACT|nr:Uncharacterized protein dnm_066580 [Desulfonema magnum]
MGKTRNTTNRNTIIFFILYSPFINGFEPRIFPDDTDFLNLRNLRNQR